MNRIEKIYFARAGSVLLGIALIGGLVKDKDPKPTYQISISQGANLPKSYFGFDQDHDGRIERIVERQLSYMPRGVITLERSYHRSDAAFEGMEKMLLEQTRRD